MKSRLLCASALGFKLMATVPPWAVVLRMSCEPERTSFTPMGVLSVTLISNAAPVG